MGRWTDEPEKWKRCGGMEEEEEEKNARINGGAARE